MLITEAKAVEPSSKGTCVTVLQPGDIGGNQLEEGPASAKTKPSSSITRELQELTPLLVPDDLGDEEPAQVCLGKYPTRLYCGRKRAF